MNNTPNTESANKITILTGIRDNLLKPMSEEICVKTETQIQSLRNQIQSLRKLLWLGIGIAAFSVLVQLVFIIILFNL